MADEPTGNQTGDGEATPKIEPNVSVQETDTAPLVADPVTAAVPEAATEETPATPATDAAPKRPEKLPDWAQKKMNELAAAEREAKREAKRLADELAARNAPASPATPSAADVAAVEANAPAGGFKTEAEFEAAVQRKAEENAASQRAAAAQRKFDDDCNAAYTKGLEAYKDDFQQAVANLQSVGVMSRDVLDLVLATEDPAKVLFDLGSEPERAAALIDMTPAKRAVEIAKLAVAAPRKEPERVSNAPSPVRPVEGTARVVGEPRDDDDDKTWMTKRIAQRQARYA